MDRLTIHGISVNYRLYDQEMQPILPVDRLTKMPLIICMTTPSTQ